MFLLVGYGTEESWSVVVTNPDYTIPLDEESETHRESKFRPFSEFIDRYVLDREIAQLDISVPQSWF